MITELSSQVVATLLNNEIISYEQKDIYEYGFEILISSLITFFIVFICGCIFNCIIPSLIYFVLFVILRSICGGYHASNYFNCNIVFLFVTIGVIVSYKYIHIEEFSELHYFICMLSFICTIIYSPIENDNKPLTVTQKTKFRILGTVMVVMISSASTVFKIKLISSYSILMDMTLMVVSIFMLVAKLKSGGEQNMNKKIKVSVLKAVARLGEKTAKIGCNSASLFGFHQPKEPEHIKKTQKSE